ncbi:hypothetical protein D9758_003269 [Tetrapyrgos nigripes]|uniref:Uncharacterized protein n=1 Tax=Tetrapyrgos nigripes TaxID=182062 RepID=A0A8H5GIW3_9AGAR|nr:hypothetical protein D9758_003269 [Tetrapyrgos nigripes]
MQMELDLPPLSFLPMSTFPSSSSSKRARSPDETEDYHERPCKRPSLATDADLFHQAPSYFNSRGSRYASEDSWVQQAGELTIDSPFSSSSEMLPYDHVVIRGEGDVAMDCDQSTNSKPRPPPLLIQTTFDSSPHLRQHIHHPNDSLHKQPPSAPQQPCLPTINVLPPTPDMSVPLRAATPLDSAASTDSPMSVHTSPMSTTSSPSRRHRFAMGPRADCWKCRMGVKGHAVHLD